MKISQKLVLGFGGVTCLIAIIGVVSLVQLYTIAQPFQEKIPGTIESATRLSHLDSLAQFIRYYDEVLTQSARNFAFTQDPKWQERYKASEPKLDAVIKRAINQGDEQDKEFFSSVDQANLALVEMEYKAIELVNDGRPREAVAILDSSEYWEQKAIYKQGLVEYVERRGHQYDEALAISTKELESANSYSQRLIHVGILLISGVLLAAILLSTGAGLAIHRSISTSLQKLKTATTEISRGNLKIKMGIDSKDEIGQLGISFQQMAEKLENTTTSIDNLEKEITEREQAEQDREKALNDMRERVKELTCVYGVAKSIRTRQTLPEIFQDVVGLTPRGLYYPEIAQAKVVFDGAEYVSGPFEKTPWKLSSGIVVKDRKRGWVEAYYTEQRPELDEGPFSREERFLIDGIARSLSEAIARLESEQNLKRAKEEAEE
jgi:HAMP domain-containing protein